MNRLAQTIEASAFSLLGISLALWAATQFPVAKAAADLQQRPSFDRSVCPWPKRLIEPSFCPSFSEKVISLSPILPLPFQNPPTSQDLLKTRIEALNWNEKLEVSPPLPSSHPIDWERASGWIDAQCTPKAKDMAEAFIQATRHVSHAQFERALQHSVSQFNRYLENKASKAYLLVSGPAEKSNGWVAQLALKYLDILPVQVMKTENTFGVSHALVDYLREHPEVKHIVIMDDAAYSCTQTRTALYQLGQIEQLEKCPDLRCSKEEYLRLRTGKPTRKFSVIIPFMTDPQCVLMPSKPKGGTYPDMNDSIHVFTSQKLHRLKELLIPEHYRTYLELYNDEIDEAPSHKAMVPIYFDHKIPDFMSSFPTIYEEGKVICNSSKKFFPFIDFVHPPYKSAADFL